VRSGERLRLGLDVRLVFDAGPGKKADRTASGMVEVLRGIRSGSTIVRSMRAAGWRLTREAWCLLEAGEDTGRLGESMQAVGGMLHQRLQRRRELLGQLWYPAMVLLTGMVVMGLILFWVVPQMRAISQSMAPGSSLPWLTEHIGGLYGLVFFGSAFLGGACASCIGLMGRLAKRSPRCAAFHEAVLGRLPLAGNLRRKLRESRCLRQLSLLLEGGLTLPAALQTISDGTDDLWEKHQLLEFRRRLLMGAGLPEALHAFRMLDPADEPLLLAGQESGQLEEYMRRIADEQEASSLWQLKQFMRFLEPAMLLFLSVAIGGLILAYLLPMVGIFEQLA
jgi:type II secretory pathway component PulF